jgi:DNA-binding SARP family transcriptional activator/tetratricopeptide (TPR) repeat protein
MLTAAAPHSYIRPFGPEQGTMDMYGPFQLRTLGRLALLDASGREDPSLATRPRKLALLAWLSLRPERRATRDQIVGLFWGERDEERARNSLSDAVSHLRRVLGRDAIRTQGAEIVFVDSVRIDVDALEVAAAAARGDHESVIARYRGPFLDGFYVNDAPGFDDWRDRERSRFEAVFAKSAHAKCAELARAESWDECRALADRWLEAEPASGDAALALLRSIDAPGTHAAHVAALAAFEGLKARLARDLEIQPDARASRFVKEIGERLAENLPPPAIAPPTASTPSVIAKAPSTPLRRWTLIGGAMLAAAALVGVLMYRPPVLDHHRVIVAALQNRTGDSTLRALGAVAADWVSRSLTETRAVEVADPLLAPTDSIEDPRVIGRRAQAGIVVLGTYTRQGDSLEIDARLVDANTGRVLRATPTVGTLVSQPISGVEELRRRILGAMAAEVDPVIAGVAREGSQPPTYDAYLAWIDGIDRYSHHDFRGAIEALVRAAAIDSMFVSPRIWTVGAYANLGEPVRADSIRLAILPLRGRMVPFDRGLLDMWTAVLRGDRQGEYASGRVLLAAAPGSEMAIYKAGTSALFANRPNEAVALLRRLPAANSAVAWDVYGTRFALALHAAGRHDEEVLETTRRLAHVPGSQWAMEEHAKALIAAGRTPEATELIRKILETGRDETRWAGSAALDLGNELQVHGHSAEASATYTLVIQWTRALPPDGAITRNARDLLSAALYASNQLAIADSVTSAGLRMDSTSVDLLKVHGLIAARRGNVTEAERTSTRLAALTTPYSYGRHTLVRAQIAAVLGRQDDATRLTQQALAEGMMSTVLHTTPEFIALRGYPPFEAIIRPID